MHPSSEYSLIEKIRPYCLEKGNPNFSVTIGDDCAVRSTTGEQLVYSSDISVENVHFKREWMSMYEIGYKSMITNLSDIASMGAKPDSVSASIVFPTTNKNIDSDLVDLYRGFHDALSPYSAPIIGGDLSKGPCWIISISITGALQPNSAPLLRSGARVGDRVWVSGKPGESARGLELLFSKGRINDLSKDEELAILAHIKPTAQIELGLYLRGEKDVHSAMDISDGVAKECRTLAFASSVKFEITLPNNLRSSLGKMEPSHYFLFGGEDYELIFTAKADWEPKRVYKDLCTPIGRVLEGEGVIFNNAPISSGGFDHLI